MDENMIYNQMEKSKKKSNSGILIAIIVIIIIIVALYLLLGQNGKTSPDVNTDVNNQNIDQNTDINQDINSDTNKNNQDGSLEEYYEIEMQDPDKGNNTTKIILEAMNEDKQRYDFNLTSKTIIEDQNSFYQQFAMNGLLSLFLPTMYGSGLNKEISDQIYDLHVDNNLSFKSGYTMYSNIIDVNSIDENMSSNEFFKLNQKVLLSTFKKDDQNTELYNILKDMFDKEIDMKNIIFRQIYDYNQEIFPGMEFAYRGDEQKLHTYIYDVNKDYHNIYDENSNWVTIDKWLGDWLEGTNN